MPVTVKSRRLSRDLHQIAAQFRTPKARKHDEQSEYWVSFSAGKTKEIAIKDLTDRHLLKAIQFLETHAEDLKNKVLKTGTSVHHFVRGLQTLDYSAAGLRNVAALTLPEFLEQQTPYLKLYREAQHRKICLKPLGTWGDFI